MTQLSDRISEILEENGDSLDYISKTSNIGRITLNRIKSGEFLPSKEQLNRLYASMRLSFSEQKNLNKLYHIARLGETEFQKQKKIKIALEKISNFENNNLKLVRSKPGQAEINAFFNVENSNSIIFSGDNEIKTCISNMLNKELQQSDAQIRLRISENTLEANRLIWEEMNGHDEKISIKELIVLAATAGKDNSVELFDQLPDYLALSLQQSIAYEVRYRHETMSLEPANEPWFRNCIISSEYCLLFSDDWDAGICHLDQNAVDFFGKKFDEVFRLSDDLFEVKNYERGQSVFGGLTKKVISQNERALFSKAYLKAYLDKNSQSMISQNEWVRGLLEESTDENRIVFINDDQHFKLSGTIGVFTTPVKTWIHLINENSETFLILLEERLIKNINSFMASLKECELALEMAHLKIKD